MCYIVSVTIFLLCEFPMPVVTLAELKAHLVLEHDEDDVLLTLKADAATAYVASFIGQPIPEPAPATIRQAILMLASAWYEAREAASGANSYEIPYGLSELLAAHRVWRVG